MVIGLSGFQAVTLSCACTSGDIRKSVTAASERVSEVVRLSAESEVEGFMLSRSLEG
jgi:hypothetical protein